jgi:Holliday junction resolvase
MSNYSRGRSLEYEIRELLVSAGYSVVRGAGSKGEALGLPADLVATKYTDQTKREVWMAIMQMKVRKR